MRLRAPADVLAELSASPVESGAVNRLVDRRLLFECAVTHYAAVNATAEHLDELDRLTRDVAESMDWSDYHQADEQFHQLVGSASGLGTAVEAYYETWAELYAYFIPYPIELLHKSNCDHVALVAALRAGHGDEAVEIACKHVDVLHRTMFMGLTDGGTRPAEVPRRPGGSPIALKNRGAIRLKSLPSTTSATAVIDDFSGLSECPG